MFDKKTYILDVAGKEVKIETGEIARQAGGSVLVTSGGTIVLVTTTRSKEVKEGQDFFPLTVDYIEKFYATGKFPGGFIKRESKPSTEEVLISRLIDRPIRPLFPEGFFNAVHVVINVVSFDGINMPEDIATIGVSFALGLSDIPFSGPVAGVTVGYVNGEYIINPDKEQRANMDIYLSVAGTKSAITMVEAGASEVSEEEMLNAIMLGHEEIKKICEQQETILNSLNITKMEFKGINYDERVTTFLNKYQGELKNAILVPGKLEKYEAIDNLCESLLSTFKLEIAKEILSKEKTEEEKLLELIGENKEKSVDELVKEFKKYYHDLEKKIVRELIIFDKYRADGRKIDEIRPLNAQIDVLKMPHGSALFTRGETQALVTATLGSKEDEQIIDGMEGEYNKKFFLHYNFPPFSVGEAGFMRAPGRRELGHGNLAERALKAVMPLIDDFPYTVRVVSEITESNGSSSQASICGGSLALMAAGVPIKGTVAGIAMGLIKEAENFTVLTDIQGLEDHLGDMDFKVAGTKKGITAIQMDIKIEGINKEIMEIALTQAHKGRMHIIEVMEATIPESRPNLPENAPKIINLKIDPSKIAGLIGPAGKIIKSIIEETGVKIDVEDDGRVSIFGVDQEKMNRAFELVTQYTLTVELDKVYKGRVTKLAKFGAFVELVPGTEGLLHISEISHKRIKQVEDVLKVDDIVDVKVIALEDNNKFSLSMKALIEKEEAKEENSNEGE
ncbi:polyribonucleotide nucleotidyltransferase [Streptobacillus moniliformis]|uniref:polyribonucleotide nucleotidyltransferase n=1 Tax=Streptobacillus moniliformis TaxID=34105 RepID=UPI0007E396D7|nr:polyribonucleotide nucleotidyltransferase [Streptobacillus moniliformis]